MGILESDGCYSQNRYKVTTISRDLAYNIGENVPYHIYKTIRPTTHKLEKIFKNLFKEGKIDDNKTIKRN